MAETVATEMRVFEPAPIDVLHPWLAFASQIVTFDELWAVGKAFSALWWEWSAAQWSEMAVSQFVGAQSAQEAQEAVKCLHRAEANIQEASQMWEKAFGLLSGSQDEGRLALYGSLFDSVPVQQARLHAIAEQIGAAALLVADAWGLPVSEQE